MSAKISQILSHKATLLKVAIALMIALAAIRLSFEFWRLVFDTGPKGAIDLKIISSFVLDWFADRPFTGTYPPASYVLLWPFLAWLPFPVLRCFWAASFLFMLYWLINILEKALGITTGIEKAWFRLFVLSNYATAIIIGNGQLAIHLMPVLLAGVLLLHGRNRSWKNELLAFVFLLLAMTKPSIAVPFFWVVLFACGSIRVVVACVVAYVGLTLAATVFRPEDVITIIQRWQANVTDISLGYANIHQWSHLLNIEQWSTFFSILSLGILGIWTFINRRADIWVLLGVTAIFARIWTYHQLYDDLLIFVPIIALFKVSQQNIAKQKGLDTIAGILIIASWIGLMMPGTLLRLPYPLGTPFRFGQTLVWLGMLVFLLYCAQKKLISETGAQHPPGADSENIAEAPRC